MIEGKKIKLLIADDNKEFCGLVVDFSKMRRILKF